MRLLILHLPISLQDVARPALFSAQILLNVGLTTIKAAASRVGEAAKVAAGRREVA